jgi:hypothetical protein
MSFLRWNAERGFHPEVGGVSIEEPAGTRIRERQRTAIYGSHSRLMDKHNMARRDDSVLCADLAGGSRRSGVRVVDTEGL